MIGYKKYLIRFVILFIGFAIHAQIFGITELESKLYFSENPINFDPPIIKKNTTIFLPIRSLVEFFDGSIQTSNITYEFDIKIGNKNFFIKPNKPEYRLNQTSKTFDTKPFIYKTRLYVPIAIITKDLGYELVKKNNHYYAYSTQTNPSIKPKEKIMFNYADLNDSPTIKKMFLPISGMTLPLEYASFNGIKKTNLTPFISYLGYSIQSVENYYILKKSNTVYSFKNGSNEVKIAIDKKIITKKLPYKPSIKNKQFFVELKPFLNDLGFDYTITNHKLVILKKLNHIIYDNDAQVTLSKNSQIKVNNGNKLNNPPRIFWDLSHTKCPTSPIHSSTHALTKITFGQHETTCRMVFHLNTSYNITVEKQFETNVEFKFQKTSPSHTTAIDKKNNQPVQPAQSLMGKTIIIDPGHGGSDPGAVNKNDYEKHYTLDISKRIRNELTKKGATVVLLRTKDTNPSLYQRVKKINKTKGDFLISVHVNSFINGQANGSETYYYKKNEKLAAKYIQKHLAKELKLRNNGIKHAKMYVLKYSNIPGVLIEPCFMTNKKEYGLLKTISFRNKIAKATVAGLEEYYKNK